MAASSTAWPLAISLAALAAACSGQSDWYYHWDCHGDPECLTTNAGGAPSGTIDEGPDQQACTPLLTFAAHFWGANATNSCDQNANGGSPAPTPTLTSFVVTPASSSASVGQTVHLTATGHYSDGSTKDLTTSSAWTVAGTHFIGDPVIVLVNGPGLVSAVSVGNAQIQAAYAALTATATVAVVAPSLTGIVVTPANPTLVAAARQQFTATATYSDNSTVDVTATAVWTSSATNVAAFNLGHLATAGLATALAAGTTAISAQSGGRTGSTTLTVSNATLVSIAVLPADPTIAAGLTLQFRAQGSYSNATSADITGQVSWASANTAVATIAGGGLATSTTPGTSSISATLGAVSGATTLTVGAVALESITISPQTPSVSAGSTQQLTATGLYSDGTTQDLTASAAWTSATVAVATVNGTGLVTGVTTGTSLVTAASGGKSGSTTVTVDLLGTVWQLRSSGTASALNGVAWCAGRFIAVGAGGVILTSPDGAAWTAQTSGTSSDLNAVACSPSLILAAGTAGAMVTSTDGTTWTVRTPAGATAAIRTVFWAGTKFFAGGDFGYPVGTTPGAGDFATSADAMTWTIANTSYGFVKRSIAGSGALFVIAGDALQTSTDGSTWAVPQSTQPLYGVAWTGSTFAAVGVMGLIYLTTDGVNFRFPSSGTQTQLNAVAWSGAQLTAVGNGGVVTTSSPDAMTWTPRTSGTAANLLGIAWSGSRLVAVGSGGAVLLSH